MLRLFYLRYLRNYPSLATKIREAILVISRTTYQSVTRSARLSTSATMSSGLDIAKCFEFVKEVTLQAGEVFKCKFYSEKNIKTKTMAWDFVTDVDVEIEKMFIDALSQEFPDHRIIAEEMMSMKKEEPELTDAPTWFIDPIDGTTNFIHTFPQACISVGLTVCKEPVLGIIYNPVTSELYSAMKGKGAFLNGKPIHTSNVTELRDAMIIFETTLVKYYTNDRDIQDGRLKTLIDKTRAIRSIGSAALSLAFLARGAVDCVHIDDLKAWDILAGLVIVNEAGGAVLDTKGGPYNFMKPHTIAASSKSLAKKLSEVIVESDLQVQRKRLKRT